MVTIISFLSMWLKQDGSISLCRSSPIAILNENVHLMQLYTYGNLAINENRTGHDGNEIFMVLRAKAVDNSAVEIKDITLGILAYVYPKLLMPYVVYFHSLSKISDVRAGASGMVISR